MSKPGDIWRSPDGRMELRCGRWQDVLAGVGEVDAVITDPPYSERTSGGYRSATDFGDVPVAADKRGLKRGKGSAMPRTRFELQYSPLTIEGVRQAVAEIIPAQWWVIFGDHISSRWWEAELGDAGWLTFAPVVWVRKGSPPRFCGDGPANSCEWITVARHKGKLPKTMGSRPGHYEHSIQCEKVVTGGKPIGLMQSVVRDYSDPGDLICDPCAGGGTTLLAAAIEGRRAIGAEMDPATFEKAVKRLSAGYTPSMF